VLGGVGVQGFTTRLKMHTKTYMSNMDGRLWPAQLRAGWSSAGCGNVHMAHRCIATASAHRSTTAINCIVHGSSRRQSSSSSQDAAERGENDAAASGWGGGGGSRDPPDASLLSEWRVTTALWHDNAMNALIKGQLETPLASGWARLHPGSWVMRTLLFPSGGSAVVPLLRRAFRAPSELAGVLLQEAHADYDEVSFLQHARAAIEAVADLYVAGDWESLRPMVSQALLASMRRAHDAHSELLVLRDQRLADGSRLQLDPESVMLACSHAVSSAALARLDTARAAQQLPPQEQQDAPGDPGTATQAGTTQAQEQPPAPPQSTAPVHPAAAAAAVTAAAVAAAQRAALAGAMWDVAYVYARGTQTLNLMSTHASSEGEHDGGSETLTYAKSGYVAFARGPVRVDAQLPVNSERAWFMLAWL
jgi:hypothetical protein